MFLDVVLKFIEFGLELIIDSIVENWFGFGKWDFVVLLCMVGFGEGFLVVLLICGVGFVFEGILLVFELGVMLM